MPKTKESGVSWHLFGKKLQKTEICSFFAIFQPEKVSKSVDFCVFHLSLFFLSFLSAWFSCELQLTHSILIFLNKETSIEEEVFDSNNVVYFWFTFDVVLNLFFFVKSWFHFVWNVTESWLHFVWMWDDKKKLAIVDS